MDILILGSVRPLFLDSCAVGPWFQVGRRVSPSEVEFIVCEIFVPSFVMVTVAPATTALEESVTRPTIVPTLPAPIVEQSPKRAPVKQGISLFWHLLALKLSREEQSTCLFDLCQHKRYSHLTQFSAISPGLGEITRFYILRLSA